MKYLILIALFFVVLWFLRKNRFLRKSTPPPARAPERMVRCVHCGVNQPLSESILSQGRYYCCAEHRQEGEAGGV